MTQLVERVARAICNDGQLAHEPGYDQWELWLGEARAAIRAILETHAIVPKEPTDKMLIDSGTVNGYEGVMSDADHIAWWKAMLAAAPDPLKGVRE
jgi:hypothetical protein